MEGYKQNQASSGSSSFTTELFGPKDSSPSPSPSRYFDFLSSHSKAHKKEPEVTRKSDDFGTKREAGVDNGEEYKKSQNPNLKWRRDAFTCEDQEQEEGICGLSSSIHYGGQEIYTSPPAAAPTHHATTHYSTLNNNTAGGVDNDGHASRGNWWLGSMF